MQYSEGQRNSRYVANLTGHQVKTFGRALERRLYASQSVGSSWITLYQHWIKYTQQPCKAHWILGLGRVICKEETRASRPVRAITVVRTSVIILSNWSSSTSRNKERDNITRLTETILCTITPWVTSWGCGRKTERKKYNNGLDHHDLHILKCIFVNSIENYGIITFTQVHSKNVSFALTKYINLFFK